jgi:hypothetical protein
MMRGHEVDVQGALRPPKQPGEAVALPSTSARIV